MKQPAVELHNTFVIQAAASFTDYSRGLTAQERERNKDHLRDEGLFVSALATWDVEYLVDSLEDHRTWFAVHTFKQLENALQESINKSVIVSHNRTTGLWKMDFLNGTELVEVLNSPTLETDYINDWCKGFKMVAQFFKETK